MIDNCDQYYRRRDIWACKKHIRLVYARWVEKMRPFLADAALADGPLVEVGSGSGLLGELLDGVMLTDVVDLPWIDRVVDCMDMPFDDGSIGGVICFDLLHHLCRPHDFLREAGRVLRVGGRVLLIEPYITIGSYLPYKLLHHEEVNFQSYHGAVKGPDASGDSDPWVGNLAVGNLVFGRDLPKWDELHSNLTIVHREVFSLFDFQAAGGFKHYAFVPYWLFRRLVKVDDLLSPLMRLFGFRVFVVLEKMSKEGIVR